MIFLISCARICIFFSLSSPSTHIFFIRSHIHHDVVWMDFTHRPHYSYQHHYRYTCVQWLGANNRVPLCIQYMWSHFCCRRSIQWDFQYLHSDGSGLLNHHHDYHEREQSEMSLKKEMGNKKLWTFAEIERVRERARNINGIDPFLR